MSQESRSSQVNSRSIFNSKISADMPLIFSFGRVYISPTMLPWQLNRYHRSSLLVGTHCTLERNATGSKRHSNHLNGFSHLP